MSAKMGRPTSNPRDKYIGVRASKDEVDMLAFCTNKTGKSKTDILMEGLEKVYNELKG